MEVTVEHLGAVQFEVKARQHTILCDQPAENGGSDEGVTPPELLLASLATCAGFYAAQYLKKFKLSEKGTKVRVSAEKAANPPRLTNFKVLVEVPLEFTEAQREGIERSVHHCLIHNTLQNPPQIELEIKRL